ncbi:MAG: hypothetical protein KBI01_04995 [Oscillospiraceae bacterium]|nr:hypothetical protein [Oscillospiraceae bacterium]
MAKRRPSGDGMVRKRPDGRWEGRIVVAHKDNGDPTRPCGRMAKNTLVISTQKPGRSVKRCSLI